MKFIWANTLMSCVILSFFDEIRSDCGRRVYSLIHIYDRRMDGYASENTTTSVKGCAEMCASFANCNSFGYNVNENICYIYVELVKSGYNYVEDEGMVYYWVLEESCPPNYYYDNPNNLCVKVVNDKPLMFQDAETECETDNGHLLVADTPEKRSFLHQHYGITISELGVGAIQANGMEEWTWLNGANITNWSPYQPDDSGNEDCLQILFTINDTDIYFNDIPCEAFQMKFICEIPVQRQ
ncbi:hypothetical protein SNE40_015086 [Patella caerulea]|uniref:C-type lectin n=1 Tax=Patella caerulea TaxID=87958 RepID=A0AAN8JKB1_PATCE